MHDSRQPERHHQLDGVEDRQRVMITVARMNEFLPDLRALRLVGRKNVMRDRGNRLGETIASACSCWPPAKLLQPPPHRTGCAAQEHHERRCKPETGQRDHADEDGANLALVMEQVFQDCEQIVHVMPRFE